MEPDISHQMTVGAQIIALCADSTIILGAYIIRNPRIFWEYGIKKVLFCGWSGLTLTGFVVSCYIFIHVGILLLGGNMNYL